MPADYSNTQKTSAREFLVKAKMYKIVAIGLFITAVMILFLVYGVLAKGDAMTFIKNPLIALAMLIPFLPSYVLAMMSKKQRSKAVNALKDGETAKPAKGK